MTSSKSISEPGSAKAAPGRDIRGEALPAFCTPRVLLTTLLLAFGLALLLAIAPGASEDRMIRLGTTSWFIAWVTILTVGSLCALRRPLRRLPVTPLLMVVMLILLLVTTVVSVFAYQTLVGLGWHTNEPILLFLLHNIAIAAVVGVVGIWMFSLHLDRSRQFAAQTKAELDALHARIRPHFLFNSLNTVAALIHDDPAAAERAVLDLSSVFRAALHAGDTSTLADELLLAQRYLSLEQWRIGDRLQIDWQVPAQLPRIPTPILTLQPLLENAVRHAAERSSESCRIAVQCLPGERSVSVVIDNDLAPEGMPARHDGNGVSLDNIRDRLALMFGERATLRAGRVDHHFRVKLVLPFEPETDANTATGAEDARPDR